LKYEVAKMGYAKDKNEIQNKAMSTMRSLQSTKNRITNFFQNDHTVYAKFYE
jgi:hypothetical protein